MAFKHRISIAIDLAANFGCYQLRIMPDIVSKLCTLPSEVAVLFDSNLGRRPGHALSWDRPSTYLLLCTGFNSEHAVLFEMVPM